MIRVDFAISPKLSRRFSLWVVFCAVACAGTTTIAGEYSGLVQSHGPVAYWRLGESSGTTAVDVTGAHNGTYQNSVTLGQTGGIVGDANTAVAVANGANDRVQVPAFGVSGTGITILAWFKPNGVGNDRYLAKASGTAVSQHYWALGTSGANQISSFLKINGTTRNRITTVNGLRTGVWCFVALTYDGANMKSYFNGALVDNAALPGTLTNDSAVAVALGNLPAGAGNRACSGVLDEVALFDRPLAATQISDLYAAAGGGLLAHWKLVETSGASAADSSPQVNHGVYTNGPVLGSPGPYPGIGNKAANFDGANDYVAIPNDDRYDLTGPMTVAAWVKVDLFDDNEQAIVTKGNDAWRLQRRGSTNNVELYCNGLSTPRVVSSANINDRKWHHLVGVYTGSQLQIYVDGALSNAVASTGSIVANERTVRIGRNSQGSARCFDGAIHDVRLYSRALSPTEIARLYGLVGHWTFNQTSGATVTDSSLAASHGNVNGGANWSTDCGGANTFDFDGAANYVSVPSAPHLQPTAALTIAAWVRGDSWGAGGSVDAILRKGDADPTNYQLAIADGRVALYLDQPDTAGIRGNTLLAAGQWHHVAAVWEGATVRIYVDGVLDNTPSARTGTIGIDPRTLNIGGRSGADQFDGMIRDVRLYNRAISDADVKNLAGKTGHWMFSEGLGITAADSSANANHATLSGGAAWTSSCAGQNALLTNGAGGIAQTITAFAPPDAGTVTFWMRSAGAPAGNAHICGLSSNWEIRQLSGGSLVFDLGGDGGADFVTTTALDEVNRWYHVAATYDSNNDTYSVYVDGQLQKSGTNSNPMTPQAAASLSFGMRTGYAAEYWQGALRDFRVYSRKLCPNEIAQIYGLVGHWKLDETSGPTAADSSPLGNHGTRVGGAWTAGRIDGGLQLDGNSDFVNVPHTASLSLTSQISVAAWVRPNALSDWQTVIQKGTSGGVGNYYFGTYFDEVGFSIYDGGWSDFITSGVNLQTGAWRHLAATFDNATNQVRIYVDGAEVLNITTTASPQVNSQALTLGMYQSSLYWNGKLDDVRVYGRVLCPSEVQALFDAGSSTFQGVKIIKWVELQ